MNVDDAIRDFANAGPKLPRASMQWALDHWDDAWPRFIELLDRYAAGEERSVETQDALFFILFLIGERRESRALPALCRVLMDAEAAEAAFGDALTTDLRDILIAMYDGDPTKLKALIESTRVDQYVRGGALEALAYVARRDSVPDQELRDYLLYLYREMQPQSDNFVWADWVIVAANLGYADFAGKAQDLIKRGLVPDRAVAIDDFHKQLRYVAASDGMGGFERDRIAPFEDAIGTLSKWHCFTEAYKRETDRNARHSSANETLPGWSEQAPYVNVFRDVGRNDPCPCGSGKKYKKCCLTRAAL